MREPDWQCEGVRLYLGDCLEVLPALGAGWADSLITDPPYGLEFMGKEWDHGVPGRAFWEVIAEACKPGAMLLAFGGTRTFHRLTCGIEDAGWEIRDCLQWLYGQGFPKSLDIGKAIDKRPGVSLQSRFAAELVKARGEAGLACADVSERVVGSRSAACWNWEHHQFPEYRHWAALSKCLPTLDCKWGDVLEQAEREVVGQLDAPASSIYGGDPLSQSVSVTAPATDAAKLWDGWGTALKPAWEPIVLAMKPLDGTFAANALKHGVAGLWIDGGRIGEGVETWPATRSYGTKGKKFDNYETQEAETQATGAAPRGRFPANLLLDEDAAAMLDEQSGNRKAAYVSRVAAEAKLAERKPTQQRGVTSFDDHKCCSSLYTDSGSASRFFYTAKASGRDRGNRKYAAMPLFDEPASEDRNTHPTVKPLALMEYLCTLTRTPTGGVVLDPFMGSGTTGVACVRTNREFVGIEIDRTSFDTAVRRIKESKQ